MNLFSTFAATIWYMIECRKLTLHWDRAPTWNADTPEAVSLTAQWLLVVSYLNLNTGDFTNLSIKILSYLQSTTYSNIKAHTPNSVAPDLLNQQQQPDYWNMRTLKINIKSMRYPIRFKFTEVVNDIKPNSLNVDISTKIVEIVVIVDRSNMLL